MVEVEGVELRTLADDNLPISSWPTPRSTGPLSSPHEELEVEGGEYSR